MDGRRSAGGETRRTGGGSVLDSGCARRRTSQFDLSARRRLASRRLRLTRPLSLSLSRFLFISLALSLLFSYLCPSLFYFLSVSRSSAPRSIPLAHRVHVPTGYQVTEEGKYKAHTSPSGHSTLSTGISGLSFTGRQVHLTSRAPGPARFFPATGLGHGWIERLRQRR